MPEDRPLQALLPSYEQVRTPERLEGRPGISFDKGDRLRLLTANAEIERIITYIE